MRSSEQSDWRPWEPCRENVRRARDYLYPPEDSVFFKRQIEYLKPPYFEAEIVGTRLIPLPER